MAFIIGLGLGLVFGYVIGAKKIGAILADAKSLLARLRNKKP